jgi:hypothetical protein
MFALTDGMHYYLCQHYVDMRKGITGLSSPTCPFLPFRVMYLCFSPANVTWLKFCGGIRTVLFSIRNDWKKVPLRFPVLIPIQGLMSSHGRLFF